MYICQDKCYRLVPEKDHRYAQVDDYIDRGVFCGICCVTIKEGSDAHGQMLVNHLVTGKWTCPCCNARPRSYFNLDQKRAEIFLKKLQQSKHFKKIVTEFFRIHKQSKNDTDMFKILEGLLEDIASRPHQQKRDINKLDMYCNETREISMFPPQH